MTSLTGKLVGAIAAALLAVLALPMITQGAVINVDMDHYTTYSGTAAAPDSGTKWNSFTSTGTLGAGSVQDSQNNALAGVAIAFSSNNGSHIYNDASSGGPNPLNLMSDYTYGATYTLVITGLPANQHYDLYAYSHGNFDNQTGTVTLNVANGGASASTTQTGDASNFRNISLYGEGYNWVKLSGTADGSGAFTFTVVNYLNGFQLVPVSEVPVITGLNDHTVVVGDNVTLNPTVSGSAPIMYQWRENGVNLIGETNSSLTLMNVQLSQNSHVYSLIARNASGADTNSMTLTVSSIPTFTINVDLNNGSANNYSGTAVAPDSGTVWNDLDVSSSPVSKTINDISDSQGNTLTDVGVTIASHDGVSSINRYSTDANSTPNPLLLMRDYTFSGTYDVTVSGLPSGTYCFWYFGHGDQNNQAGTVTIDADNGGGSRSTANSALGRDLFNGGEGISYVSFSGKTVGGRGSFKFQVANFLNGFQLQRSTPPIITGLTNQTVIEGNSTTLSPAISGVPYPSLQWRSNSVAIAGATNASLALKNVQYTQNATVYSLVASNPVEAVTNSMTLTVIVTPVIGNLNNQAVAPGTTVTMAPTVSGMPAPTLQWLYNDGVLSDGATGNGSIIGGSMSGTLSITNVQVADSGTYSLVAGNAAGVVTNSMTLTVSSGNVPPSITGPTDQTVVQGDDATFSASVSGLPIPTLQWQLNGTNIPAATNTSITVSNVQYAQNGDIYSVIASNTEGSETNSATLHVLVPPSISQQPTNTSVFVGSPAQFSVVASGVPDVSYQWSRNGSPIANATNASYTAPNVTGADNGAVYSVLVSNSVISVTSSNAVLTALSTMTGSFRPTNGAVNISPDQQLRIVFSSAPQLGAGKFYVRDAADNSIFATIDTSLFHTYTLFSATITNGYSRVVQGSAYQYMPIAVYGNEAWITLHPTNCFAYNKTYYVNFDTGLFRDAANASFPGISSTTAWRFSIKTSGPSTPTASTGPTNLTIGLDGAGDFATIQGAADWVPQNNTLKRTFSILPGVYREYAILQQNRNNVSFIGVGASRKDVQIIYLYPSGSSAATWSIGASDVYVRNLTIDNDVYHTNNGVVFAGPINTLFTTGDRLIFDNVLIKGGQDTIYANSGTVYFNHCEVWGSVDYIYGGALAVFDQCDIVQIRNTGGPITAPSTPYAQPYGEVFLNCTFPRALTANGYPYDVGTGNTTFQRPWRQDGYTAIINCAIGSQISTKGWSEWDGRETTCRARETGTTLVGGGTVTPAQRQAAGAYWLNTIDPDYTSPSMNPTNALLYPPDGPTNRVAVTINTNDFTLDAIYGNAYYGLGSWRPTVIPTITSQPTSQTVNAGAAASFMVAATGLPVPAYQWQKNGTNLVGETNATLTVGNAQAEDVGTYSVIVSNSAGSVSSSNVTLNVVGLGVPEITTQPTNQTAALGATVNFSVTATGNPTPVFQWRMNGTNLPNVTNATLTLSNVQVTDIGVYSVIASNNLGTATSSNATFNLSGANGFCMINSLTTGGAGGPVVTVTNGTDFNTQINIAGSRIVQVQGPISVGRIFTTSDKTIIGLGTNATLLGNINISGVTNVIVQNLRITSPGNDGLTIWNAQHVWVDHCTFYDCGDGCCDMNNGSQYVTVSWCKFHYLTQVQHQFTMIADGYVNGGTTNYGYYTLHHNWWSAGADQRMPASSYGRIHMYDNYFDCTNNYYCSNARNGTHLKIENNYYAGVNNPVTVSTGTDGKIHTSGDVYSGCTGTIYPGTDSVFSPPYGYLLDPTADVPAMVMVGAGASGPDRVPVPAKVWDGGGASTSWNTANNWGLNETPKMDDTLIFSGTARLANNNNFSANTEFRSLSFSNNAGAFVLGGNAIKLGSFVADDSAAAQTMNFDIDFSYGFDHYPTGRVFNVSSPAGSLVINGNIAGNTNRYFNSYSVTKEGPGTLVLEGINTFIASLYLNGGVVQFNTLNTNSAGSLGAGSDISFNGGGLRWASGNLADISLRTVKIQSGGATLDSGANDILFSSPIGNGGTGGLTKMGTGRITLTGNNNYSGATRIAQGTLALESDGALPNSSQIILSNTAALDVSGRSDGTLTVGSGKSLAGNGSVLGSVIATPGATVAPGASIGRLAISGVLTFQSGSTNVMELSAATHTNDLIAGMSSVNYGGTLVLSNLGGTLAAGDSFKLFSAGSYHNLFDSIAWPALSSGLTWTNRLATDGSVAVVSVVNTTPTDITAEIVGGALQLSWPADHIGWHLEVQTNSLGVGLGANWTSLGYETTNSVTILLNFAGGSIFYRLAYR